MLVTHSPFKYSLKNAYLRRGVLRKNVLWKFICTTKKKLSAKSFIEKDVTLKGTYSAVPLRQIVPKRNALRGGMSHGKKSWN